VLRAAAGIESNGGSQLFSLGVEKVKHFFGSGMHGVSFFLPKYHQRKAKVKLGSLVQSEISGLIESHEFRAHADS
jgi:hypothetical protein